MKTDEKRKIYENYTATVFHKIHQMDGKDFEIYRKVFRKNFLPLLPENHNTKILDIGCGLGHFLYFLESEGYKNYIGIDVSDENINYCRQRGFNVDKANIIDFITSNVCSYDVIVMNDVLEHFTKSEITWLLDKIYSSMSDRGMLIVKVPNAANPLLSSYNRYIDFTHEIIFTEPSLFQVLANSGFRHIEILPNDIYVFTSNPLNYLAKYFAKSLHLIFRLLFLLHGSKSTKIFTKHLIAVAIKD